ncbi:ABC transporter substrate-binding protein [Streptomyces albus]|uniref:Extracellular solute-binding protein n=1 Tax=Streptomyces albus TaxID=1888 RepID=A0A8H1LFG6_9ACTN|nr:extracellular solute-binding protein [Streptomyces albus]TGG83423.1 extracellular solute-binding protein [Streptomyces albus]UVN56821.1 extracellular solute-binding protein [Streptomyces albus]
MHRRQFLLGASSLAATAGLGVGLTGCSGGSGRSTLTVLAASYDKSVGSGITEQWNDVIHAFGRKHPDIEVDLQLVPFTRIDQELARRVKDGDPPDISQGNVFAGYAEDGDLYHASDVFKIPVQADFIASFAQAGEVDFAQYGIPFLASTPRLFYNTALFERAGLSGPPGSWAELRSAAQALKKAGVHTPYGLAMGPEAAEDEALAWMLAADGGYASSAGYDFVKSENVHALTWLRTRLVADGLAGPDPAGLTRTKAYEGFLKGRIAMMNAHPLLLGSARQAKVPCAHAPFPKENGGAAPPVGLSDWLMAFRAGGRRKECSAFLNFLYQVTSVRRYGTGQGTLPVTVSGSRALRSEPAGKPLRAFIDQMPDAEFQPMGRRSWPAVRTRVQRTIGKAVEPKGPSPRAVLDALQKAADEAERTAQHQ